MSRADAHHTTKLSTLIREPFVRAAFEVAERDGLAPPWRADRDAAGAAAAFDRETARFLADMADDDAKMWVFSRRSFFAVMSGRRRIARRVSARLFLSSPIGSAV
jgi:hypothetical protein